MRKLLAVSSLLLVLLAARPVYATTDCSAGTYMACCSYFWYDFSPETLTEQKSTWDCWTLNGMNATTMNLYSTPGFEVRSLSSSATRSFTVPTNFSGHWEVTMFAELINGHSSWYNQLNAYVNVYHPATNSSTNYTIYQRIASIDGDDSGSTPGVDFYNVAVGDTITIYINGVWSFDSDSHTRFSNVHLLWLPS